MSACHPIWSGEQTRLVILVHAPGAAARLWETNARQPTPDRFWENRPPSKHQHPSSGLRQVSLYNGGDSVWQYEAHHERCPPPTLRDTHWHRRDSAPLKRPAQTVAWCAAQSGVHSVVRQPRPSVSYRSRVLPVRTLFSVLSQWSWPVNALSHSQTKSGLAWDGWD